MNLKTTPFLFGLLLTILFLFGLMLVYKKNPVDENLIMPTMQADADIDTLRFVYHHKDKEAEADFTAAKKAINAALANPNLTAEQKTEYQNSLVELEKRCLFRRQAAVGGVGTQDRVHAERGMARGQDQA